MATAAVAEEIATNLEEVAQATRRIDPRAIGFFGGGLSVGFVVGFFFGYRWNREKIKAEAFAESKAEVDKIREIYQQKAVAAQPKPSVEVVVEERGYAVATEEEEERPLKPPVPGVKAPPPVTVKAPPVVIYDGGKSNMQGWNFDEEVAGRVDGEPYIIHMDERNENPGYSSVVYTYWAEDDVLTDEDNRPLPHAQEVVGINNLRFGHGSDDIDVVFVRNDELEIEMEICRLAKSYAEEILGHERPQEDLEHSQYPRPRNRKRRKK
jgi:hypothetical protein